MSKAVIALGSLAACFLAALALTLLTPDNLVPVVSTEIVGPEEASRTLEEVGALLVQSSSLTVEELQPSYPALIGIEGKEPAGLLWAVLGIVIGATGVTAVTRASNPFGRILLAAAAVSGVLGVARAASDYAVHSSSRPVPGEMFAFALADVSWIPLGVVIAPLLIATFPNGRFPTRRWRWLIPVGVVASLMLLVQLTGPVRYDGRAVVSTGDAPQFAESLFTVGIYLWNVMLLGAASALVLRFKRAAGVERAQLKWLAYGVVASVGLLIVSDLAQRFDGDPRLWGPVATAGFLGILPATFLAAVFRYRLYDLDRLINRSVIYSMVVTGLVVSYVALIAVVGTLVGASGIQSAIIAMVVVAFIADPLRERVASLVNRRIWRRGAGPRQALANVARAGAEESDIREMLRAILTAIRKATGAVRVVLILESPLETTSVSVPDAALNWIDYSAPVGGEGRIDIQMGRRDRLRRTERRMITAAAAVAASVVNSERLRLDLDRTLGALFAERTDLQSAQRRLSRVVAETMESVERDLHDGAQARAVALAARIGLARAVEDEQDTADLLGILHDVESVASSLAHGLDPPALRGGDLAAAIRSLVEKLNLPAQVEVNVGEIPDEVRLVAYFAVSEALANAAKHAPGAEVRVSCVADGAYLRIAVTDRGQGLSGTESASGLGLANMRERVEALGGFLRIGAVRGPGTSVLAMIPNEGP